MKKSKLKNLSYKLFNSKRLKANFILFTICATILIAAATNVIAVSPGAPDFTFGTRGVSTFNLGIVTSTALQADGKIVVGGYNNCDRPCNANFKVARFNANGTLDTGFGTNGISETDYFNQSEGIVDIVIQTDGKIVVAGSTPFQGTGEIVGFKFVRYMPDGSLDTTFGTNGRGYESFNDVGGYAQTMVLQPDGKFIIAGTDQNSMLFVARFDSNGGVDTSFGTSGRIATNSFNVNRTKIALQPDGKIVITADSAPTGTAKLIRFNANGTLDNSFGSGGVVTSIFADHFVPAVAVQANGKIILSGDYDGASRLVPPLRRFNVDGSVDTSFAAETGPEINGYCINCTQNVRQIITLPDNSFYLIGHSSPVNISYHYFLSVSRYLSNGTLDTSFGFRGASYLRTSNSNYYVDVALDAILQPDGKIVLAGEGSDQVTGADGFNFVMRINTTVTSGGVRGDFDGDGKTDFSVFRPSSSFWYTLNSSNNSNTAIRYGLGTDTITPGDYYYDRKTDISVFRPSANGWYVFFNQPAEQNISVSSFGQNGDISVSEDFDGDGKTDIAVFRPSNGTWYIRYSSQVLQGVAVNGIKFGQDGDKPVAGDYDGDGRADIAVFRPSTGAWYILRSSDNGFFGVQFGIGTDRTVPADYDGDLKTDIAVYRDGAWYILQSSNNGFIGVQFGEALDKPVPGDYDGDGKTDVAVFRPTTGSWYLLKSSNGAFIGQQWGISEDIPILNAFVR